MDWLAVIVVLIILFPLAIFILRRLAGLIALMLGILGIVCLVGQQYVAGIVLLVAAVLLSMLAPPDDPDTDYL